MGSDKKLAVCPTCGAKTKTYKHSLSGVLVRGFRKVLDCIDELGNFDIAACDLNYSERENLRKLQYWDIIEKRRDPKGHGGRWRVTVKGLAFAEGWRSMQYSAITYRGALVRFEGDQVHIFDLAGGWRYRPDYARDSRPFLDDPNQAELFK